MKFGAVIFDLDGTLLDTLADIANAMNFALERLGFPLHPADDYRYFTGNGMYGLAGRSLPEDYRDDKTTRECMALAKDHYRRHWIDNTKQYPGIPELLDGLEKINLPKAVFSNKPDEFTKAITAKMLSKWSFEVVRGESPSAPIKPDPAAALDIARTIGVVPAETLYLGDTNTDMKTANAAGMYAVGALWGFRGAEELLAAGAKILVSTPQEVLTLICNQ